MKHTKSMQEGYVAPAVSLLDVAVEAGFEASMPGVSVKAWENDGESALEF